MNVRKTILRKIARHRRGTLIEVTIGADTYGDGGLVDPAEPVEHRPTIRVVGRYGGIDSGTCVVVDANKVHHHFVPETDIVRVRKIHD